MGADAFYVYYGVRYEVTLEAEIDRLEGKQDERVAAARKAKLMSAFGRLTDGEGYFLLVGHEVGCFGNENSAEATLNEVEMSAIFEETKRKLNNAGFRDEPRLIFQLCAQY